MVYLETFNIQLKARDKNIVELIEKYPGRWISISGNKYSVLEDSPQPSEELFFGTKPLISYIPYGLLKVDREEKRGKKLSLAEINPENKILPIGHYARDHISFIENIVKNTALKEISLNLPEILELKKIATFPVYFNRGIETKINPLQVLDAQNQIPPWIRGKTFAISDYGSNRTREFRASSINKFKFLEYEMIIYDKTIYSQKMLKI